MTSNPNESQNTDVEESKTTLISGEKSDESKGDLIKQLAGVAERLGVKVDFNNPSSVVELLVTGEKVNDPSYVSLYDVLQYLSSNARKKIAQGVKIDTLYLIEKAAAGFNNKQKFIAKLDMEFNGFKNLDALEYFSIYPNSYFTDTLPTEFMGAKLGKPELVKNVGAYLINGDEEDGDDYVKVYDAVKPLFLTDDVSWDLDDCLNYLNWGVN